MEEGFKTAASWEHVPFENSLTKKCSDGVCFCRERTGCLPGDHGEESFGRRGKGNYLAILKKEEKGGAEGGWSGFMLKKLAFTQGGIIISMLHEGSHFLASRFRSEGETHLSKVAT
jgi:hypothetical protein